MESKKRELACPIIPAELAEKLKNNYDTHTCTTGTTTITITKWSSMEGILRVRELLFVQG